MFNPIIAEVHMKLAGSNRDIDVKKEESMAQFEKNHYKIEFSKVKQWELPHRTWFKIGSIMMNLVKFNDAIFHWIFCIS